jgi:hypothetical protein
MFILEEFFGRLELCSTATHRELYSPETRLQSRLIAG